MSDEQAQHLAVIARAIRASDRSDRANGVIAALFWILLILGGLALIGFLGYDAFVVYQRWGQFHVGPQLIGGLGIGGALLWYGMKGARHIALDINAAKAPATDVDSHPLTRAIRDGVGSIRRLRGVVGARHEVWVEMGDKRVYRLPVSPHEVEPLLAYFHRRFPDARPWQR